MAKFEEVGFASEIWFQHVCKAFRFNLHYGHDVVKRKISKRLTAYQFNRGSKLSE